MSPQVMNPDELFNKGMYDQYQTFTVFTDRNGEQRYLRLGEQLSKPSYANDRSRPYELTIEHCEWHLNTFINLAYAGKEALEVSDEYWYSDDEIDTIYLTEEQARLKFREICTHTILPIMGVSANVPDGTYVTHI